MNNGAMRIYLKPGGVASLLGAPVGAKLTKRKAQFVVIRRQGRRIMLEPLEYDDIVGVSRIYPHGTGRSRKLSLSSVTRNLTGCKAVEVTWNEQEVCIEFQLPEECA